MPMSRRQSKRGARTKSPRKSKRGARMKSRRNSYRAVRSRSRRPYKYRSSFAEAIIELTPNEQLEVFCKWIKRGILVDADKWIVDLLEVFDNEELKIALKKDENFLDNVKRYFTITDTTSPYHVEQTSNLNLSPTKPGIAKRLRMAIGRHVDTPYILEGAPSALAWIVAAPPLTIVENASLQYQRIQNEKTRTKTRKLLEDVLSHITHAKEKSVIWTFAAVMRGAYKLSRFLKIVTIVLGNFLCLWYVRFSLVLCKFANPS